MRVEPSVEETKNAAKYGEILEQELHSAKRAATQAQSDTELMKDSPLLRKLGTIFRELGITGNSAISNLRK